MTNAEVVRKLREMALYLEMEGIAFKPQAYERAAYAVAALDRPLDTLLKSDGPQGLQGIHGVGRGIASRIAKMIREGTFEDLEEYRKRVPADLPGLTAIDGLGPKRVKLLWERLSIKNLDELERAVLEYRVRDLPGFGRSSESRLLESIIAHRRHAGRWPIGEVLLLARTIEQRLKRASKVEAAAVCGSVRRFQTMVKDLDFLVVTDEPDPVMKLFAGMPEVERVHATGSTKTLVRLEQGIDADLRVVRRDSFGSALQYFTGSKAHNVALRKIAISKGLKLSEYGLLRDGRRVAGEDEVGVYEALGLQFIPPELREDDGEIEAATTGRLPKLIQHGDLRGDLQIHTNWTDGHDSIQEVVEAARRRGLEYIAITDHTKDLAMTGGLHENALLEQAEIIRALDARTKDMRILAGAEVNIRRDGSLDIADEVLASLDIVGAAVHSHFSMPREEATRRLIRAMENPNVDIIFHPSARQLMRRDPLNLDIDAVIDAAIRTGTILEIDAQPDRLDLDPRQVRRALERGAKLVIDSDAHHASELRFPDELGIGLARRGWAQKADVLNTSTLGHFLERAFGQGG